MTTETETQPPANAEADSSPRCAVSSGSDSSPLPGTPEWSNMHTTVAVMVEGKRHAICAYLRSVANSIEMGCTSGMTGDANPARGQWIGTR